jgi:transcriptional regulator with XRE-family HTH domain
MSTQKEIIGRNINRGIVAKGLTNRQLAQLVNKSEIQISKWRNAKNVPTLEHLAQLADVLYDGDLNKFYAGDEAA